MSGACKIDHAAGGVVPSDLCRTCRPELNMRPLTVIVDTPEELIKYDDWREDRLTDADRKAIEEIKAEQAGKRSRKKDSSLGKVKAKSEDKANLEAGGRWDAMRGRWVTDAEDLEHARKIMAKRSRALAKLKQKSKAKNARRVTRKPRSKGKGGKKASNS